MSEKRTQSMQSPGRRDIFNNSKTHSRRETRAERTSSVSMLEFTPLAGGPLKTCGLFFGGESRAGS